MHEGNHGADDVFVGFALLLCLLVCTLTAYAGLHIDLLFCTVKVYAGLHSYCVCWFALLLYRLTFLDA